MKEDWFLEFAKAFLGAGLCWAAIILVCLFALGCSGGQDTSTIKTEYVAEEYAPVVEGQENPYGGIVGFLVQLVDFSTEDFLSVCSQYGGSLYTPDEGELVCAQSDSLIYAIKRYKGMPLISSVMVPRYGGKLMADAVLREVGPPHHKQDFKAIWELQSGQLTFGMDLDYVLIVYQKYGVLASN